MEADYDTWIKKQLPDLIGEKSQREVQFAFRPVISVLVPAYETPESFLRQMIKSVLDQSYAGLELCIADGSATDRVEQVVREYAAQDERIRYERLAENKGISQNTNAALALASGDYVGLLDHDDILLPGALYELVKALNEQGEADALYTDEDKVSMDLSRHFQPHFKPDFNMEYLCSNNYICHFFLVKRAIALAVGGFRSEFDGAQDHDFIFRCTEQADRVLHIPKVLYSWRSHETSTAANPESKLYAYEAGKRAVAAHLQRCGIRAQVLDTNNYGFYRVCYGAGGHKKLRNSFENLHGQTDVKVVYYDKACNNSVTFTGKEHYVLFTCVRNGRAESGFWDELLSTCERSDAGMVCARVYDKDKCLANDIRMEGVKDPFGESMKGLKKGCLGYFHRAALQQEISEPTDCFLVKRECLQGQESLTVREVIEIIREQGYKILYQPWAVVYESR
jgi:glycosyltransferase involved in cell wall biosynthesis